MTNMHPVFILRDICVIIFNFLRVRDILNYAILSTETNELVKKIDVYNALVSLLTENHNCSLEDLTISTIKNDKHQLLDLLERSGVIPCLYFGADTYELLVKKCALKTIRWFEKRIGLKFDANAMTNRIVLAACCHEKYLQTIKDRKQFLSNNPDRIKTYIHAAITENNTKAVEWFREKYPELTDKYLFSIVNNLDKLYEEKIMNQLYMSKNLGQETHSDTKRQSVNWLFKNGYMNLNNVSSDMKIMIIKNAATTDIYGNIPIEIIKSTPSLVHVIASNSCLIHKYEPFLLQFRTEITKEMKSIIQCIIYRNDIDAFNWICSHYDVIICRSNILYAFAYGCIGIIQYLAKHNYLLGNSYAYLDLIISLPEPKIYPILKIFETMAARPVKKQEIFRLIDHAIDKNTPVFLEWLFEYYGIKHDYFNAAQLEHICDKLLDNRHLEVTQFFVDRGYKIRISFGLFSAKKGDGKFIKYVSETPAIESEFVHMSVHLAISRIIEMEDLEILQWYIASYSTSFKDTVYSIALNNIIKNGTEENALWLLNHVWETPFGPNLIHGKSEIGIYALLCGRTKILDWLREKKFVIRHPRKLIDLLLRIGKFNSVYYLREYFGVKLKICDSIESVDPVDPYLADGRFMIELAYHTNPIFVDQPDCYYYVKKSIDSIYDCLSTTD